jgi:leucyl-tRNA synthetase
MLFYNLIAKTREQKLTFLSAEFSNKVVKQHVNVELVNGSELDVGAFKASREEFATAKFIYDEGIYTCSSEVEKMSKSKFNVVNPDDIITQYGADTLRLFEMFLGPLEQSKPWDTDSIEGVHRFLRKFWRLYHNDDNTLTILEESANKSELKTLHKTIKKVTEDIERYSFNTGVSAFMICVNELQDLKCNKREILMPLCVLIEPYAPHIAEELWNKLGNNTSIAKVDFPIFEAKHLIESSHKYPVSFNGKMRFTLELPLDLSKQEIEKAALSHEDAAKWLEGKTPKKVIVVPKKIVNVVV